MIRDWHLDRYCAKSFYPDHWVEDDSAGYGVHWCRRHCPVLQQCKAEQEENPQPGVYAGELWVQNFNRSTALPVHRAQHQPKELWCTTCQISSAKSARTAIARTVAEAPGATVVTGLVGSCSDAA